MDLASNPGRLATGLAGPMALGVGCRTVGVEVGLVVEVTVEGIGDGLVVERVVGVVVDSKVLVTWAAVGTFVDGTTTSGTGFGVSWRDEHARVRMIKNNKTSSTRFLNLMGYFILPPV